MTKASSRTKGKEKALVQVKSRPDRQQQAVTPQRIIGGIPHNYFDLLRDVVSNDKAAAANLSSRPLKLRKTIRDRLAADKHPDREVIQISDSDEDELEDLFEEDDEDVFEEVDLNGSEDDDEPAPNISKLYDLPLETKENITTKDIEQDPSEKPPNNQDTLVLEFTGSSATPANKRRRGPKILPKAEKHERLLFHKLHLICLLRHVYWRNKWCNDYKIRKHYKRVFPVSVMKELHPASHLSTTLKTRKLLDGLRHAISFWNEKFTVANKSTRHGLLMLSWAHLYQKQRIIDNKVDLERFRNNYLLRFRGNRDMAAQGFCAALRAINLDARLVCSLQPMDFKSNTPTGPPSSPKNDHITTPEPEQETSNFPVFWVEVWNKFEEKWISVDPVCTKTVDVIIRKSKLEPPASDSCNSLRYVLAFDHDGKAVDVTRRYANLYNAKTRKKRVDSTVGGQLWLSKALKPYIREHVSKREVMEQQELASREACEEIPSNIQDFKGHPLFVLEQHLKQNEILDPKVSIGTLALRASGATPSSVNIYRRKDVKTLRSEQNWYKMGRILKKGVQPLKRKAPLTKKRKRAAAFSSDDDDDDDEESGVALYSEEQTEIYVPPPVVDGMVPKNRFKNIDIYCASMIPQGAVHLPYPNINIAARLIEVDYADAVTGFDYHNRRTIKPHITGIVVAQEYEEAVRAVYDELLEEQRLEDERIIRARALIRWRRYLIALRIKDRLNREHGVVPSESNEPNESDEKGQATTIQLSSGDSKSPEQDMLTAFEPAASVSPLASEPDLSIDESQTVHLMDSDDGDIELLKTVHRSYADQPAYNPIANSTLSGLSRTAKATEDSKNMTDNDNYGDSDSDGFLADSVSESELY